MILAFNVFGGRIGHVLSSRLAARSSLGVGRRGGPPRCLAIRTLTTAPGEDPPGDKSRSAAVAELLEAATGLASDVRSLKARIPLLEASLENFDAKLNAVIQTRHSSNDKSFDARINTVIQLYVASMKSEVDSVNNLLEEERKRFFERAMGMTNLESFSYPDGSRPPKGNQMDSSDLAKEALRFFSLGCGFVLPKLKDPFRNSDMKQNEFEQKFIEQIKVLIQREPRVEKTGDGEVIIYFE